MMGRDLTRGPVPRLLVWMALPVLGSFALQSLYALADLYFIGFLGGPALAGVGISLNSFFIVLVLGQTLGTGALALISQAYGRGDRAGVREVFQQSFWLMLALGTALWIAGLAFAEAYFDLFTDDPAARREGLAFFRVYTATFLFQSFLMAAGACWRAIGDFLWPMGLMAANVLLNLVLDPLLIFGVGPFPELGVAGAAWASVIAQGSAMLVYLWMILAHPGRVLLRVRRPVFVDVRMMARLLRIGVPAGVQFLLAAVALGLTYRMVRPFGVEVTAAVGVGFRIIQSTIYPAVALGVATASLVGQNHGAGRGDRVRRALLWGAGLAMAVPAAEYVLLWAAPGFWIGVFAREAGVVAAGADYLLINGLALPLIGFGLISTFASQALGSTMRPLGAVATRVAAYGLLLWAMFAWLEPWAAGVFWCYTLAIVPEAGVMALIWGRIFRAHGPPASRPAAAGAALAPEAEEPA